MKLFSSTDRVPNIDLPPLTWREKKVVYLGAFAIAAAAWAYLGYMAYIMNHMDMYEMWMPPRAGQRPWAVYDFFMLFSMWSVMMVAMMTPSVMPMVHLFQAVRKRNQSQRADTAHVFVFYAGYLIAWVGFSAVITVVQWLLHITDVVTPMMDSRSQLFSAAVLIIAGIYQWTPWKDACLHHCRTPLTYLMTRWKKGITGALSMGVNHGLYCIGCCWGLMLLMFALGVMNILWMVLLSIIVLFEKIVPGSIRTYRIVSGFLFLGWGVYWVGLAIVS